MGLVIAFTIYFSKAPNADSRRFSMGTALTKENIQGSSHQHIGENFTEGQQ